MTARALAECLGQASYRTVLVDGNPGQQSQRAFLNIGDGMGLERAALHDLMRGLLMPDRTHTAFALLPGPLSPMQPGLTGLYGSAISALRDACDMIVVDADRVDATLWASRSSFAGGVMRPFVDRKLARILFRIGQTGSQLDDGIEALAAIGQPTLIRAIGQVPDGLKPHADREWERLLDGLASWGGSDQWTRDTARMIDQGAPGWPKGHEPIWLTETAIWMGADPNRVKPERKRRWPWIR